MGRTSTATAKAAPQAAAQATWRRARSAVRTEASVHVVASLSLSGWMEVKIKIGQPPSAGGAGGGEGRAEVEFASGQVAEAERRPARRRPDENGPRMPAEELAGGGEVQRQAHRIGGRQSRVVEEGVKSERSEEVAVGSGLRAEFGGHAQLALKVAGRKEVRAVEMKPEESEPPATLVALTARKTA